MINISDDMVIGVVAHDAGAAAQIAHYIGPLKNKIFFSLRGPAIDIFRSVLGEVHVIDLETVILNSDVVICGTGWQTDFEWQGISMGRKKKKFVVACIDHWTNYESRFVRNDLQVSPSEIWVFDAYAKEIASSMFPAIVVRQQPDLYLASQVKIIKNLDCLNHSGISSILYLLEPMRECWSGEEPAEFEALDHFISNLDSISNNAAIIYLKLHPSESHDKYDKWLSKHQNLDIRITDDPLSHAISRSDIVVGCRTYAMVVALYSGRTVYSSIPRGIETFVLPYPEISQF